MMSNINWVDFKASQWRLTPYQHITMVKYQTKWIVMSAKF